VIYLCFFFFLFLSRLEKKTKRESKHRGGRSTRKSIVLISSHRIEGRKQRRRRRFEKGLCTVVLVFFYSSFQSFFGSLRSSSCECVRTMSMFLRSYRTSASPSAASAMLQAPVDVEDRLSEIEKASKVSGNTL